MLRLLASRKRKCSGPKQDSLESTLRPLATGRESAPGEHAFRCWAKILLLHSCYPRGLIKSTTNMQHIILIILILS